MLWQRSKQNNKMASHPPVKRTLTMVALVALMEPISATMLFPFIYFMVNDFDPSNIGHIGLHAGLISMYKHNSF